MGIGRKRSGTVFLYCDIFYEGGTERRNEYLGKGGSKEIGYRR